ncbi:MAG: hypothetical protein ACLP0J_20420 [Solirubrobacteraceae bacterium]
MAFLVVALVIGTSRHAAPRVHESAHLAGTMQLTSVIHANQRRRTISLELRRHFSIFRHSPFAAKSSAAQTTPPLPGMIASGLTSSEGPNAAFGLDPSSAAYVSVTPNFPAWVVPGSAGVCVVADASVKPGPAFNHVTCTSASAVIARPMLGFVTNDDGTQTLYGLVSDNVTAVSLTETNGVNLPVAIVSNMFAATFAAHSAASVTIQDANDGSSTTVLPSGSRPTS